MKEKLVIPQGNPEDSSLFLLIFFLFPSFCSLSLFLFLFKIGSISAHLLMGYIKKGGTDDSGDWRQLLE